MALKLEANPSSSWLEFANTEANETMHHELVQIQPGNPVTKVNQPKNYEEPKCCQICLSSKLAIFTVTIFLILMGTLVLVLDLTVWEVERAHRNSYYQVEDEYRNSKSRNISIIVRGLPNSYEVFESIILDSYHDKVVHLDLEYATVSLENLENVLHRHSYTLRTFMLQNVRLTGQVVSRQGYVNYWGNMAVPNLADLESFVLKLNQPIGPDEDLKVDLCENCIVTNRSTFNLSPFSTFRSPDCFKPLIPFTKENYQDTGNLFDLNIDLSLSVYDWTFFKLNVKEGEITSMVAQSNEILKSIPNSNNPFVLRKLSLKNCDLEAGTLQLFAGSLTHLILDSVNISGLAEGTPISQILTGLTKLEYLTLKNNAFAKYYSAEVWGMLGISANMFDALSKVPRKIVELSHFPTTLKNLSISDYDLTWNSAPDSNLNFNLDLLALHNVNVLNDSIVSNFSKLFKCKKLALQAWDPRIRPNTLGSALSPAEIIKAREWHTILYAVYNSSGMSWIFIDNTNGGNSWNEAELGGDIQSVLLRNDLSPWYTTRFVLDRKKHPSFWEPKGIVTSNDAKLLWFELLQMETFVRKEVALFSLW